MFIALNKIERRAPEERHVSPRHRMVRAKAASPLGVHLSFLDIVDKPGHKRPSEFLSNSLRSQE